MNTVKKILKWLGITLLVLFAIGFTCYLIWLRPVLTMMEQTSVIPIDKDLTIVIGGGGNSGILASDSMVLVVDTKMGDAAEAFAKQVKDIAGNKPIVVVNTHYHSDHTGGNKYFIGQTLIAGGHYTKEDWLDNAKEPLPTEWLIGSKDIKIGDDTATILEMGRNAHTASDVFVYLHKRKMLFGGDVILNKQSAALIGKAADPDGYFAAFDMLPRKFNIVTIVPGHGAMGGLEVIQSFKGYFEDMKTAAADETKREELIAKYKDWTQVPFVMSPRATMEVFKKKI